MHKKTHTCGEMFQDFYDPGHMCYMTPVLSEIKHVHKDTNKGEFDVDSDNAKYEKPLYILFDFECTQDDIVQWEEGPVLDETTKKCKNYKKSICGALEHVPKLCIAHRVCGRCIDKDINSISGCNKRGKNENIFSGVSTTTDLCKWLFSEKHSGATVICHNLKIYDSFPHFAIFI